MNNQQLYLAWLRTYSPTTYANAIRRATGQGRSLGGLTDDLLNKALAPDLIHSFLGDDTDLDEIPITATYTPDPVSFDSSQIDFQSPTFDTGSVLAPTPVAIASGGATGLPSAPAPVAASGNVFTSVLAAVAQIGAGVLNYSNQSKLIALNTTRAQQGLPPVDANGRVVTALGTATTSPGLLAFEKAITGGGGMSLIPILAILGIGLFFLSRPRSAS